MPTPFDHVIIAAKRSVILELDYRKKLTDRRGVLRLVEPYSMSTGKQDTLVRCYQIEPEQGWRYFMIHKIKAAKPTEIEFKPRRPVTLPSAEVEPEYIPSPHWTESRKEYRDAICDALADARVTGEEFEQLRLLIESRKIGVDDIRFVHSSLFHRCLGAIMEDGFVDKKDELEIRFLHRVFGKLGWTVGDVAEESPLSTERHGRTAP